MTTPGFAAGPHGSHDAYPIPLPWDLGAGPFPQHDGALSVRCESLEENMTDRPLAVFLPWPGRDHAHPCPERHHVLI